MFFGIATATCDHPGNSCHVNNHQQADGEVYRRVRFIILLLLCNSIVEGYVTVVGLLGRFLEIELLFVS